MIREDQSIGNHHVFSPAGSEDYDFGDVVGRQRFASAIGRIGLVRRQMWWPEYRNSRVYGVGFGFVAVESDDGEFLV